MMSRSCSIRGGRRSWWSPVTRQQPNRWYERAVPRAEHQYEMTWRAAARTGGWAMSGYTKWDRAVYVDRVGREEEAERRREALMARQRAYRLVKERKRRGLDAGPTH